MRRLSLALLITAVLISPAYADPITGTIAAVGAWYASIGAVGQLLVQVGVSLALSAASYGLSYLIGGAGKRQQQARQETQGTSLPEFDALLEAGRAYGTITTAGAVFFHKTVAAGGSSGAPGWRCSTPATQPARRSWRRVTGCASGPSGGMRPTSPWLAEAYWISESGGAMWASPPCSTAATPATLRSAGSASGRAWPVIMPMPARLAPMVSPLAASLSAICASCGRWASSTVTTTSTGLDAAGMACFLHEAGAEAIRRDRREAAAAP